MAAEKIKDDSIYTVVLAKTIKVGRFPIPAGTQAKLRGDVLKGVVEATPDAVASYSVSKK